MKEEDNRGDPKRNIDKALVFIAVMALGAVPYSFVLERVGGGGRTGRLEADKGLGSGEEEER